MRIVDQAGIEITIGCTIAAAILQGRSARMRRGEVVGINESKGTLKARWIKEDHAYLWTDESTLRRGEVYDEGELMVMPNVVVLKGAV